MIPDDGRRYLLAAPNPVAVYGTATLIRLIQTAQASGACWAFRRVNNPTPKG